MRVIAICGPNHCGSTMLGAILGSSPRWNEVPHIGEAYAFFKNGGRLFGEPNKCVCCKGLCEKWSKFDPLAKSPLMHLGKAIETDLLVDSSKKMEWFQKAGSKVELSYVYIWKDPAALRKSFEKRKKDRGWNNAQVERMYSAELMGMISHIGALSGTREGFVGLSLETLLKNPKAVTQKLCDELGLDYFDGKENFWNFDHHHFHGASSVTRVLAGKEAPVFRPSGKVSGFFKSAEKLVQNSSRVYLD